MPKTSLELVRLEVEEVEQRMKEGQEQEVAEEEEGHQQTTDGVCQSGKVDFVQLRDVQPQSHVFLL